jgi:hypothetical protein
MAITFPSLACFTELKRMMKEEQERFRKLGFIDVTFGVRVTDGEKVPGSKAYKLAFQTFACTEVKELTEQDATDFILEASYDTWKEMFQNIRTNGQADRNHTINTLSHLGSPIRVLYEDPDGHDRLFRYNESIQEFFNLSTKIDLDLSA